MQGHDTLPLLVFLVSLAPSLPCCCWKGPFEGKNACKLSVQPCIEHGHENKYQELANSLKSHAVPNSAHWAPCNWSCQLGQVQSRVHAQAKWYALMTLSRDHLRREWKHKLSHASSPCSSTNSRSIKCPCRFHVEATNHSPSPYITFLRQHSVQYPGYTTACCGRHMPDRRSSLSLPVC